MTADDARSGYEELVIDFKNVQPAKNRSDFVL
jgi:hypothetical protein